MPRLRTWLPALASVVAVGGAVAVVVWQLQPALLLRDTLDTGGDTGAHVATVAYLRTALLPHLQVTGWDPGWYDGFPLYTFYFPLPDLLAALGGWLVPPDIAFKLVTALGPSLLPVAAWVFGRLAGLERPRPEVLAAATLPFVFDQTFTIDGGNIYSTMAGEYAYTLALVPALVFVGCCLAGMRTGRWRAAGAAALAACALCHAVPAMYAVAGGVLVLALHRPTWRRAWWLVSTGAVGGALVAFWALPFLSNLAYSTNMGYAKVTTYAALLAPGSGPLHGNRWVLWLAGAGVVAAVVQRRRPVLVLAVLGGLSAAAVVGWSPGGIYNVRFLPLWWLSAYLVAGSFVAEAVVVVARARRSVVDRRAARRSAGGGPAPARRRWPAGAVVGPLVGLAAAAAVVVPPLVPSVAAGLGVTTSQVPSWVAWDYSGYQAKPGWRELQGLVATVGRVVRHHGCGRVMWEYSPDLDRFGTPMALMDLPMWTGGCATTQEGLLFESSATTPFHFIDQAELSAAPSEAMVGLPYPTSVPDVAAGVAHLQLMGVPYLLVSSPVVEAAAAADPSLHLLATSGPWHTRYGGRVIVTTWELYAVRRAPAVVALTRTPAVLTGVGPAQRSWLPVALRWYDRPADWATELVAGGPARWPRVAGARAPTGVPGRSLPPDRVTGVRMGADTVRFRVSRPGVPVLVKVSYFPNWHVTGALGPWRATPNLMVVVPTAHTVVLSYGSTPADTAGTALSAAGLVGLLLLARRRRVPTDRSAAGASPADWVG